MKAVMFTNFLNHHQLPFCLKMEELTNNNFYFVTQKAIAAKRIGTYKIMDNDYDFLLKSYENEENLKKAYKVADWADTVIIGSSNDNYVKKRLKDKKLTFRYSERLFKEKNNLKEFVRNCGIILIKHGKHFADPLYMLCSSAYTANDFNSLGVYKNKVYKWGYFPENIKYNINDLLSKKDGSILWAGRLIDWKHPEVAIEVAKKLKQSNHNFIMNIIGQGDMYDFLLSEIEHNGLSNNVHLLGSMPPEEVRKYMEKASVFIFTSDTNEGWGAVLNEAMNSGCACVSSHLAGSSGFLIKHNKNGLIYNYYDINDFFEKVLRLLDDDNLKKELGKEAYNTIDRIWNASIASDRFIKLSECLLNGEDTPYDDGPCSKAKPVCERKMYKYLTNGNSL